VNIACIIWLGVVVLHENNVLARDQRLIWASRFLASEKVANDSE
jgi:hypothetical protein